MLVWVRTSDVPDRVVGEPRCDLSEDHLKRRMAQEVPNKCLMSRFEYHQGYDFSKIKEQSAVIYEEKTGRKNSIIVPVAKTWYPPSGGYLGWHIDQDGGRLYSAYAEGKSFFRIRNPETGEIITSWDKPNQWSFRIFDFDINNPMWHCVYAEDLRVSVGYRFVGGG